MKLGILGGGQLAQMLALAALPLGVRVRVLEPDPSAPAALCAEHLPFAYTDAAGLNALAECDAVTLEFENVPPAALEALAGRVPVRPGAALLSNSKHRHHEKTALRAAGAQSADWSLIETGADLAVAFAAQGGGILKTAELGYDGKGQRSTSTLEELQAAFAELGGVPCVLEKRVPFVRELSLSVARGPSGQTAFGPLVENVHKEGILHHSIYVPGRFAEAEATAREMAVAVAEAWGLEGLITLEFFQLEDGALLVNEVAPRVHNSGHLTQSGGGTSQFEAQVRAVLDLPLFDWRPLVPVAMLNIIGAPTPADQAAILATKGAELHLYHKAHRVGRKLGHVNILGTSEDDLRTKLAALQTHVPFAGPQG